MNASYRNKETNHSNRNKEMNHFTLPVSYQTHGHVSLHSDGHQGQVGRDDGHVSDELKHPTDDVGRDEVQLHDDGVGHDDGTHHQVNDGQGLDERVGRPTLILGGVHDQHRDVAQSSQQRAETHHHGEGDELHVEVGGESQVLLMLLLLEVAVCVCSLRGRVVDDGVGEVVESVGEGPHRCGCRRVEERAVEGPVEMVGLKVGQIAWVKCGSHG